MTFFPPILHSCILQLEGREKKRKEMFSCSAGISLYISQRALKTTPETTFTFFLKSLNGDFPFFTTGWQGFAQSDPVFANIKPLRIEASSV